MSETLGHRLEKILKIGAAPRTAMDELCVTYCEALNEPMIAAPPGLQGALALECATRAGNIELATLMIKYGADVNKKNLRGMPVICQAAACACPEGLACVQLILARGGDANATDHDGRTPLFHASRGDVIELLLEAGANIKHRDEGGKTALHTTPTPDAARTLIRCGADKEARDSDGNTPSAANTHAGVVDEISGGGCGCSVM